jgi:predicted ATPase
MDESEHLIMASPELDSVTVRGFKSIALSDDVALTPINLLIGANGSGKSNFIEVFSFLHAVRDAGLQNYVRRAGGADELLHFGSKETRQIEIGISFKERGNQYRLTLSPTDDDSLYPAEERVLFLDETHTRKHEALPPRMNNLEACISNRSLRRTANWVRTRLGNWRVYHVHDTSPTSPMRKTAKINDNELLRPDGSNLAAFLYLLQLKYPDAYGLIRASIQRVAPFFDDFRLRPDPLNEETIRLAWKHRNSDKYFGVSALSDGTLRFIAIAALFLQPHELRPSVIVVDEPELGLHPAAISLLASLMKQASPQTQIIVSTQSALLLDHFRPEDVLVAERLAGSTHLRRLEESSLREWLEEYSLGQLWEKNELGGRPGN